MVQGAGRTSGGAAFGANLGDAARVFQDIERKPNQRDIVTTPVTAVTTLVTLLTVQPDRFLHLNSMAVYAASAATVTVHFVPDGGTADASNIMHSASITGHATLFENKEIMLEPGSTVQVLATASANVHLWGVQISGGDPL